jgi:four helix bundle protein
MSDKIFSYRDLDVWKRSRRLVKMIYDVTESFPKSQLFSLCQQMQRAAVSVPSNIAEGQVKRATRDYIRHLNIALGSIAELDTQVLLSQDLGYIDAATSKMLEEECAIIGRMLNKLVSSLEAKLPLKPGARILEPAL